MGDANSTFILFQNFGYEKYLNITEVDQWNAIFSKKLFFQ